MTDPKLPLRRSAGGWLQAHWNWKSAVLSAGCRGLIFFAANASSGWSVAMAALNIEFLYRAAISGWFGSLTERAGRPGAPAFAIRWLIAATVAAHGAEWGVHAMAGTAHLAASLAGSVALSVLSTAFNLFAMRRGTFIVGAGRRTLGQDLRILPGLITQFARAAAGRLRLA